MAEPGSFLNPKTWALTIPANMPGTLAWWGLQTAAPNTASLLSGAPPPPLANFPAMPGKVPSTNDQRIAGAIGEIANIGINFLPLPSAAAAGPARGILGLLRRSAESADSLASRSVFMYNPPVKSPRPFVADYPSGALTDAAGRLTADIEGRPLTARYVVGRKVVGGDDIPFSTSELDALTEAGTGKRHEAVAPSKIAGGRGAVGSVRVNYLGRPTDVYLSSKLTPDTALKVHAHELGHVIDQLAGEIPTKGISKELRGVYNTLNNPNRSYPDRIEAASWGKPFVPEALGYKGEEIPREYVAEAIRAYMADPNYLKTVAPKAAAAIRSAVNSHPTLSKIIQFNSIAGLAAMNGVDTGSLPIPKQQPPIFSQ